jgi:hypothetical protein
MGSSCHLRLLGLLVQLLLLQLQQGLILFWVHHCRGGTCPCCWAFPHFPSWWGRAVLSAVLYPLYPLYPLTP